MWKQIRNPQKEKKATKYKALKMAGCGNVSQIDIILSNWSRVMTVLDLGLNSV